MAQNAREIALKILYEIDKNQAYSNISLNRNLEASELQGADRALVTELVYGTVKWKGKLDYIISQFSKVKMNKLSVWILNILRLGAYQILFMDRIPVSAACNESVKLARKYGHNASSGFVNAVLRKISSVKAPDTDGQINQGAEVLAIKYPDKNKEPVKHLAVKYSHPEWLVDKWIKEFGFDFTEGLLQSNNETPELNVRVNSLKTNVDELTRILKDESVEVNSGKYLPDALTITNSQSLSNLNAFKEGLFQVQDESSMLVAYVVNPNPGELVLDLCSAPGGKTTHMAQKMNNKGKIIACDVHTHKLDLVLDNAKRLGINIIKTLELDARIPLKEYFNKADKVLVDAPCSGLGIMKRKPDIRWARTKEDISGIIRLQEAILNNASKYVKAGGALVYSTCTIGSEENIDVINSFLNKNSDFTIDNLTPYLPVKLKEFVTEKGCLELYPNIHKIDGFFICRMTKKA